MKYKAKIFREIKRDVHTYKRNVLHIYTRTDLTKTK